MTQSGKGQNKTWNLKRRAKLKSVELEKPFNNKACKCSKDKSEIGTVIHRWLLCCHSAIKHHEWTGGQCLARQSNFLAFESRWYYTQPQNTHSSPLWSLQTSCPGPRTFTVAAWGRPPHSHPSIYSETNMLPLPHFPCAANPFRPNPTSLLLCP